VTHEINDRLTKRIDAILAEMREMERLVVAFSGGVDSSVVAALAYRALGDKALAVTAVSETLPERELQEAREVAAEIGIPFRTMSFSELDDERFVENTSARCFFCQSMRFDQLQDIARAVDCDVLASGTNASDLGDHRPGLKAMEERRVYQPLLDHELDKGEVRELAKWLGLSVWDKPAKACLSSRIPHGIAVTNERLRRIEKAEDALHERGFRQYRVRDHDGLARIEVGTDELERLLEREMLDQIKDHVRNAGFDRVTVDLSGYTSGSLNPR
jgi:uncharacterized protein (TIGR00268 family)